jgi:hypothetical protein
MTVQIIKDTPLRKPPPLPGAVLIYDLGRSTGELVLVLIALKSDNFWFFVISCNIVIPHPVFAPKTPQKMGRTVFVFCLIIYHRLKNCEIIYTVGFLLVFLKSKKPTSTCWIHDIKGLGTRCVNIQKNACNYKWTYVYYHLIRSVP